MSSSRKPRPRARSSSFRRTDRKSTRLNSSHPSISYAVFCLKKKKYLRVQELLSEEGIHSELIDPISLVPLDTRTIVESANLTGRLLLVDNAWTTCVASAEIL